MELFYISGNGNPEKVSYIFSKESFLLYFRNGHPKIFFTFQEELPKPQKLKFLTLLKKKLGINFSKNTLGE